MNILQRNIYIYILHIDYKHINNKIKFLNLLTEYKLQSVIVFFYFLNI